MDRSTFWGRLAYRSKGPEAVLYLLALSGLLCWDGLGLAFDLVRLGLGLHVVLSLTLFPLLVLPFWLSHRRMRGDEGRKASLRQTGRFIDWLLGLSLVSGVWLVILGNRGDWGGRLAFWAHLLSLIPLVWLIISHAWRYSVLRMAAAAALMFVAVPAWAETVSSASFLAWGGNLYSANFQAGSVSRLDARDGALLAERSLGRDIQRLALAPKVGMIAATDPQAGDVHFLGLYDLAAKGRVHVGGRPMGVVHDDRHGLFWVALFEGHRVVALDHQGAIRHDLKVEETPRGLALLADGRLLVSHSLVGKVSVLDVAGPKPILRKVISLAENEDPSETVPQGKPRLLDQIAVSPDGTEAWLPHLLWNFDHPFQFQSTVFPAISVLSLAPGQEDEAVSHRKLLFKQINIIEEGTRTRIVSNPDQAVFSADGGKVYVTASASEDLLVFDRSRGGQLGKAEQRGRRIGKMDQGGAKAIQIFRHLPGDNPRGIARLENDLFVQNAQSLDVSRLDGGEAGSFGQVAVINPRFAALVSHDPVEPGLRRGLKLFHQGNTDKAPDAPLAGDFWMSCASCHVDGFNFTNGYLLRDTKLNKSDNALPGHRRLKTMVAGDFAGDYIRMIQDTQGGMGHDGRFGAPLIDPDNPPPSVRDAMADLHKVVTAPENLPYLSTWLRLDDPKGRTHADEWTNSADCAACHKDMVDQWADSLHRLMGEGNPYYRVVEDLAAKTEGEDFRKWCMGCHQPQGIMTGKTRTDGPLSLMEKGAESLFSAHKAGKSVVEEGTGCLFCHRITKIEDAAIHGGGNASLTVNLKDRATYLLEGDDSKAGRFLAHTQINAKPQAHAQSYSQPFYKDSRLCGTCHGEFSPGTGVAIVDTYGEWAASAYNNPSDPAKNRTCQDCHMHGDIARIGQDVPGVSTDGGKVKANVVTHQFTGANHHLVGLRNQKLAEMSLELLRSAARLSVVDGQEGVTIRVANVGAGHALPTGVADFREVWLDVTVTDALGRVVLQSGKLDATGALPEQGTRMFRKVFGDAEGKPAGLRFWRYEKLLESTMIPAGGHRDEHFDLPADAAFPVTLSARLMFRIYPQWVSDAVRASYPQLPNPPAVEMTRLEQRLTR